MIIDSRSKQAAGHPMPHKVHLRWAAYHVANLLPVLQVFAMKNRYTREVCKRGINEIVIRPNLQYTWIRIKAGQHRVDYRCEPGRTFLYTLTMYLVNTEKSKEYYEQFFHT
jgi:hypothetical protein